MGLPLKFDNDNGPELICKIDNFEYQALEIFENSDKIFIKNYKLSRQNIYLMQ